jgi:hypothetical protein
MQITTSFGKLTDFVKVTYRILSWLKSPNSGEIGPIKPLLKDKSLQLKYINTVNLVLKKIIGSN